jgi:tetratricopeptide (TPR) repeat protein
MLLQDQGDFDGAKEYLERALAIYERILPPDDPVLVSSLTNLGSLLYALRNYSAAKDYFERALVICERILPADHPLTVFIRDTLHTILQNLGDRETRETIT